MYRRREEEAEQDKKETNEFIRRTLLIAGILTVAVAVPLAFLALGCGKQTETAATNATQEPVTGEAATGQIVVASTGGITGTGVSNAGAEAAPSEGERADLANAVPPDVAASAPDSVLTPGGVVEITAEGSPDVSDITLTDRLGKKTAFTYDTARSLWRVSYRVPLRSREDLLGLSVTATNPAGLSKRVWIFLKFREPTNAESVEVEPATGN